MNSESRNGASVRAQVKGEPDKGRISHTAWLDLIYQGPLELRPWQQFLDALQKVTNATRVSLQLYREESAERDVRVASSHPSNNIDWHELLEVYRRNYMTTDPIRHHKLVPGRIVTLEDCRGSAFYRELLQPVGIEHLVRACVEEPSGLRCWLQLYGHRSLGPFNRKRDVALVKALLPHLQRALGLYASIMRNQSEKLVYEEALGHLAFGSLLLDGKGRIIHSNVVANELFKKHPGVGLCEQRIALENRRDDGELKEAIARAIQARKKQATTNHVDLVRTRSKRGALLGFLVLPTPWMPYYQGDHVPNVIVYICDLEQRIGDMEGRADHAEQLVGKLFGLTSSEARLAVLLADGLTVTEASREMRITEGTARNYSKRIFEKTGIKRQPDLVRMIYRSVALLG